MGRFRGRRAFAAVILALAVGVASAATAVITPVTTHAESTSTSCAGVEGKSAQAWPLYWENQCQLVNDPIVNTAGYDRETFVLDPGRTNFLTRDQLIARLSNYETQYFSDQFIWYAPLVSTEANPNTHWSSCYVGARDPLTFCNSVKTSLSLTHTVGQDLTVNQTLDRIEYDGNWIALACGNFSLPVYRDSTGYAPGPVPTIHGMKFNDANRDGVQDDGEGGVGGVPFILTRTSSQVGQSTDEVVASTTSAADGTFAFPLNNHEGPGTYVVQEMTPSGWVSTTPPPLPVVVDEGVGDRAYQVASFGDIQETGLTAQPVPVSAVEGQSFSGPVATFTDADGLDSADTPSDDAATIHWGDGSSSAGAITSNGGGSYTVSGTHTYAEESTPTIQVSVSDLDDPNGPDGPATTSFIATVADAALSATGTPIAATEGAVSNVTVATFTDANPGATVADFTSNGGSTTIDWGDKSSSAGTVTQTGPGQFAVSGTHTYAEEGSDTASITIVDDGGSTATVVSTATISDALLSHTDVPCFVSLNPVNHTVANFTDANPGATVTDFTKYGGSITVDWGDGSTGPGTVSQTAAEQFSVIGTHTYAALGQYTITVPIVDDGGSTTVATTCVTVYAPSAGGAFVIGQNNTIGAPVTFWSAQWDDDNTLSGGSNAFKGFETSTSTPACGDTWTSGTGNSVMPPDTIPTYMEVIVASNVSQSGSTISGNIQKVVIVRTDPGYGPNPGHAGTGTIVATLCG